MIRRAKLDDIREIVSCLRDYSLDINIRCAKDSFSSRKVSNLVRECIIQRLAWVYEEERVLGCILAREQLNIFSDTKLETHLIGLYVDPSLRGKSIGGKLIINLERESESRNIGVSWIGVQSSSQLGERSLNKLGYVLSESIFLKER